MTHLRFIALALLFCGHAQAESLRFGAGIWDYEVTGSEVDNGVRRDFQRDLDVRPGSKTRVALEFDWRKAWWPDLAATYSEFGGDGDVSGQNGGSLFGGGTSGVTTRAELRGIDFTARWPLPLGDFTFSPGLSLQKLDGEVVIEDSANNTVTRQALDEIFPQIHGELRWEPLDWLSISGVVQAISDGEQSANEYRVLAGVQVFGPLRLEAGWQQKRYDLQKPQFEIHTRLSGALFQAGLAF